MLRRETYETERTFNEINTSPTLFGQPEEGDMMQSESPPQKSRRGRKRQSDEECLSEAERVKKEKNRKAAQKCREKKEKEARDLRTRNEELERENKKLAEEKQNLEKRAQTFNRIIEKHIEMGCKVPSNVQDMLQGISSHSSSDECEAFRAVGTIERDHTPPHTPESSSSGKLSPHLPFTYSDFPECQSVAPTALFSGTLLSESDLSRKRNPSTSRSSSSSPAPSPSVSPVQAVPQTLGKQKDLSYFLGSDSLPDVLTPIPALRPKGKQNHVRQFVYSSGQAVPTVVSEIEETSKEYMPRTFDTVDRSVNNIHTSDVIATALQLPDVPAQDEVAIQLSIGDQIPQDDETNQNLSSMGFSCVEQYSFSEDLHQMESVQEICIGEYSSDVQQSSQQLVASDKQDSSHLQRRFETHLMVNVSACAPALLDMGPEMSESLQQQIKMSYVSSSDSVSGAVSGSVQPRQNVDVTQQNVVTQPVQVLKHPLLPQQQLNAVKGQQLTADGQLVQVLTSHKEGQATNKEVQVVVSPAKVSLMQKQLKDIHEPYQSQEAHRLQRQVSGQIQLLTNSPSTRQQVQHTTVTRQMSKELPVQQSMQNCQAAVDIQIPAGNQVRAQPSANKLIIVTAPKDNLFESMTKQSSITFASTASSVNPPTPQLTPQRCQTVKQTVGNGYLLPNVQSTRTQSYSILTSCMPQIQNLASESSASTADIDYSVNVQDLPSLNFTELNSDNNLFEKKPSRSSS